MSLGNFIWHAFENLVAMFWTFDYQKKMRIERQVFFKSSINATNIAIRRNKLSFHSYECAIDGLAKPGSDLNKKGCATILSVINLANVTVSEKEFKEKVFFGSKSILVEGDVTNRIIGGMEGLSNYDAKLLNDKSSLHCLFYYIRIYKRFSKSAKKKISTMSF